MADGYISQIKTLDNKVYDFRDQHLKVYTGSCATPAATAIKDVTTDGKFTLAKGAVVFVNFSVTNTAAVGDLKLKFNGEAETNAKPIKYLVNGNDPASIPGAGYLRANQTYMFQYDGTNWVAVLNYYYNSNNFASMVGHYNNILARKAITAESLIVGDSTGYEKVASGVTFDLAYPIVWCTANIAANASNYANMYLQHYDRNIATGAKTGFTSSANKVIYLIVTIDGNIATIDSNIITDTLPSTADGKVYISLGKLGAQSTGANYFFLYPVHPMFEYKNGKIRTYEAPQDLSEIDGSDDLKAIEAISGNTGLLKKTAANTWTLDTNTYSLTSHNHNSTYLKLDGSNNMTADVNIIAGDTDKFVNFWYNTGKTAGASWRIGMLGSGSSDTNYFVIQSGTSTASATAWNNVLRIGQNTYNIYIPSTTDSTSTTSGALTVEGGIGVKGQLTATRLAANGSNTSYNLYVNGNSQFNIGTSDSSADKKVTIQGNNRQLSIGAQGMQAYSTGTTASILYLQYAGGNLEIGSTSTASAARNFYGVFDFKSANGFTYSGIGTASDNTARPIWFSYNGIVGRPVYDNDFKYNPSTNTLTIGTGTLTASNYSGKAATAGTADKATAANLTTTANAVAYYTNTTGTFGYKASANGALYATAANGALQWGTLPIAQGGTGKTSAADAWTALGGGASGKHADSYFIKAITSVANRLVKFTDTSSTVASTGITVDSSNNLSTSGDYIENAGGRIQYVQLLPGGAWTNYAADTWYRCCKITPKYHYINGIIQFSGEWSTGAPTIATVSVQIRNTAANLTLLHCAYVGNIKAVRLVRSDSSWWLDVQVNIQSSGTFGTQTATFIGNIIATDINTTLTATTDTTAAASTITFSTNYLANTIYKLSNAVSILDTTASTTTATGALLVSGGAGIGGRVTAQEFNATRQMVLSAGKVYSNISGSNVLLPAKTTAMYANGIAIANPGLTAANDVGWIRVLGTAETDMVLEIATGDDGGSGEQIVARQYNTSNAIAHEAVLLSKTGATSFPVSVTAPSFSGSGASLTSLNASNLASGTVPVARLPLATTSAAGAVKVGSGISVSDGTISVTAANLGLSNAMHFIGIATTAITDGGTEDPTISGYSTKTAGDVVIDKDTRREYVWSTTNKWELLGFDASAKYEKTTSGNTFISKITQATDGTVTAESRALDTSGTWSGNAATATNISGTTPTLAAAIESNEIKVIDLGNSAPESGKAHRHAIDFRWYNSHWAIGNLRTGSSPSAGFGFSYSSDGGTTYSNLAIISTSGKITATGGFNGNLTGNADTADALNDFVVSKYSIPAATGVRIQYPTYAPVLISVQRANSAGRLILLGGGYGANTIRNDFTELVSPSTTNFTWSIPASDSISNSIEVMNLSTSGEAQVVVWSKGTCTFTQITALTTTAINRTLLHSSNYTNYTVTKTGSGASGSWGISVTGTAANVTGTVAVDHGGTNATTAAGARTNLGLGSMATETATNYMKWQTTSSTSTALYNFGAYCAQNTAAGTGPNGSNYYNLINIPYRKASGNTKADWGWQLGNTTSNDNRMYYRTSGDNVWGDWQTIAHATTSSSNIGSATQPVYMTSTGVITAGTALGASAYHDDSYFALASHGTHVTTATVQSALSISSSGSATKALTEKGTFVTFGTSNLTIGTTATTAMAGNTTVTNVSISADTTTNKEYALVFGTTASDGTNPTAAKTEGLQKNITKLYTNPSTGTLYSTKFCIDEHVTLQYNTTDSSLEFVFA